MFQFVLSNVGFGRRIEATDNGGGNGSEDSGPGEEGGRGLLVFPAHLLKEADRMEDFGETLGTLQEFCDKSSQRIGWGRG